MAEQTGFEPATFAVSRRSANQLRYCSMIGVEGENRTRFYAFAAHCMGQSTTPTLTMIATSNYSSQIISFVNIFRKQILLNLKRGVAIGHPAGAIFSILFSTSLSFV